MSQLNYKLIQLSKKTLAKKDANVCGNCFKGTVECIHCDSCLLWMYFTCTIIQKNKCNAIADNYICQFSNTEDGTK